MTAVLPGLTVEVVPPPAGLPPPLRTDVAGFVGATRRGPLRIPVRVEGLTGYRDQFGDLAADATTSYAVRGYFENGGELAWIVRVFGAGTGTLATTGFRIGDLTESANTYRVEATSPGAWANNGRVTIWYRSSSLADSHAAELDVRVAVQGEPVEVFMRVPVAEITERLASRLIRITPDVTSTEAKRTPLSRSSTTELRLDGGADAPPGLDDYLAAVAALGDQPEVAIVAAPDLGGHLTADAERQAVVTALLDTAARRLDQLVLLDVPTGHAGETPAAQDALAWVAATMRLEDSVRRRAAAVYYPGLLVADPLGGATAPLRTVPPSGHVAGVISRLDRERGAHHTPANVILDDAVDLVPVLTEPEQVATFGAGLNLLRCAPGRGLQVWGGRTLDPDHPHVAHRRLLHRLVRAVHRAADPLVFDVNGPELRLSLVRAVTSVLLAAFRAGALAGARPQDGFRLLCDDSNNPPGADPGQVVCEIAVAPAVPMEFIHLRLLIGPEGRLEVVEA
jgi:phage tail sheath protein FI